MNCRSRMVIGYLLFVACAWTQIAHADYIGVGYEGLRIRDDGTLVVPSNVVPNIPQSIRNNIETYDQAVAVSSDFKKFYLFVNTLGFSNYVIAADSNTAQFLPNDTFMPGTDVQTGQYINQAQQPLIKGNDLYVLSTVGLSPASYQIKHYDLTTKTLVGTINPPTPQKLDDIALGSSLFGPALYVSSPTGIYAYLGGPNFNTLPPDLFLPGVEGNIAVGPDNLLYVRNFANGDVQRYNQLGVLVDTFISHTNFPGLGTIQFGFDGNLHAFQGPPSNLNILTFSGTTGALLFTTPNRFFNGRITYVPPVPEPTTIVLLGVCLTGLFYSRQNSRRQ